MKLNPLVTLGLLIVFTFVLIILKEVLNENGMDKGSK